MVRQNQGRLMTKSNEELVQEIDELRTELKQMKEIIGMLLNMVADSEDEEEEEYLGLPEIGSVEAPRFNT